MNNLEKLQDKIKALGELKQKVSLTRTISEDVAFATLSILIDIDEKLSLILNKDKEDGKIEIDAEKLTKAQIVDLLDEEGANKIELNKKSKEELLELLK